MITVWTDHRLQGAQTLAVQPDRGQVLRLLQCDTADAAALEALDEYEDLAVSFTDLVRPCARICAEPMTESLRKRTGAPDDCCGLIYLVMTLGRGITDAVSGLFAQDHYLSALLLDQMANCSLYAYEKLLWNELRTTCKERACGISGRLNAPEDFSFTFYRYIFEACAIEKTLQVMLTDSCMFVPEKTMCTVFTLTKDTDAFLGEHCCSSCRAINCMFRDRM